MFVDIIQNYRKSVIDSKSGEIVNFILDRLEELQNSMIFNDVIKIDILPMADLDTHEKLVIINTKEDFIHIFFIDDSGYNEGFCNSIDTNYDDGSDNVIHFSWTDTKDLILKSKSAKNLEQLKSNISEVLIGGPLS
jgi:hypothetical protein